MGPTKLAELPPVVALAKSQNKAHNAYSGKSSKEGGGEKYRGLWKDADQHGGTIALPERARERVCVRVCVCVCVCEICVCVWVHPNWLNCSR